MFSNPLSEIGAKLNRTLRSMVLAAAAGAAGVAALFFFSVAGFLWLQQTYGTISAALAVGCAYSALAAVAAIAVAISQRHATVAARAAAARTATPQWWADPAMLTTGIEVLRILGARRMLPLALAAVVAGFVLGGSATKRKEHVAPRAQPNGRGTFEDARN